MVSSTKVVPGSHREKTMRHIQEKKKSVKPEIRKQKGTRPSRSQFPPAALSQAGSALGLPVNVWERTGRLR